MNSSKTNILTIFLKLYMKLFKHTTIDCILWHTDAIFANNKVAFLYTYMGGISQDMKRQKCGIFYFYSLGFLDHLKFCCFDENYHVF